MSTPPLINVDAAQVTRGPDGTVTVDDPDSPLLVQVQIHAAGPARHITGVCVRTRHPHGRISPAALARLPLAEIRYLALAGAHPNESFYRTLARPKPHGQRSWDPEHWDRVWTVWEWAHRTGRPGGANAAVAEFWGVCVDPTVSRWMAHVRRLRAAST